MHRRAGIYQPPPAMVEAIEAWVRSTYAGHIAAKVRAVLALPDQGTDKYLVGLHILLREAARDADRERTYKTVAKTQIPLDLTGWVYLDKAIARQEALATRLKSENEAAFDALEREAKSLEDGQATPWFTLREVSGTGTFALRYRAVRREARYFLEGQRLDSDHSFAHPSTDIGSFRRKIESSFSGRYTSEVGANGLFTGKGNLDARLKLAGWDAGVGVKLDFAGKRERGGQYSPSKKEIEVVVNGSVPYTVEQYRTQQAELATTVGHEARHMAQSLLRDILKLNEEAGVPPRRMRDPLKDESGKPMSPAYWSKDQPHAVRDIEFHPRLHDEVRRFRKHLRTVPKHHWRDALRRWVGQRSDLHLRGTETSEFFFILKRENPTKWRKAVSEFVEEIERLVDIPAEDGSMTVLDGKPAGTDVNPFGKTVSEYWNLRQREDWLVRGRKTGTTDEMAALWHKVRDEYGTFVDALSPQALLRHKEKVEQSGLGFEYYLTPRWLEFDGYGSVREPLRDKDGNTIVEPHPKLRRLVRRVAREYLDDLRSVR